MTHGVPSWIPPRRNKARILITIGVGYIIVGILWMIAGFGNDPDLAFDWIERSFGPFGKSELLSSSWIITGILCNILAYLDLQQHRHVPKYEPVGYGAAIFTPTLWGMFYLISIFNGNSYGLRASVLLFFVAWLVFVLGGIKDAVSKESAIRALDQMKQQIAEEEEGGCATES